MYKLCKTEETVKRQREIELGLFSMLKTVRFDNLSITELCEKIQIPRKAFYRYFDSKEDALCALILYFLSCSNVSFAKGMLHSDFSSRASLSFLSRPVISVTISIIRFFSFLLVGFKLIIIFS